MKRVTGILVVGAMWLPGCEGQAPGAARNDEAVAVAGVSAAGIDAKAGGVGEQSNETVVRRVWGRRAVDLTGDVSFDGRELVFVDYDTGDLAVRDLRTGETRKLTDKGSWEESGEYGMTPKMSRDGRLVAYTWAIQIQNGTRERYELRIISVDGTGLQTLYRDESVGWIEAVGWYPDGGQLLAKAIREEGPSQILQISVPDGASRILQIPDAERIGHLSLSPDGQFVVFDRAVEGGLENQDIYLMTADGSQEVRIVEDPANDLLLDWAPDGDHILFASDRGGTLGAWLLPLEDGRPSGEPVLVRPDMWQMTPIRFTRDGSYYYVVDTSDRTVYMARLDPATGDFLEEPTPVPQPAPGPNSDVRATWSPDGRSLAYVSERDRGIPGAERATLALLSVETGETHEIDPRGLRWISPSFWSRDGRFILGYGRDLEDRFGFHKVNVLTGETHSFSNFWGVNIAGGLGLTADGESLVYKAWLEDGAGVAVRGLEGGMGRLLYRWKGYWYQTAALSPDGRNLALGEEGEEGGLLLLMPISGGDPDVLVGFPLGGGGPEQIAWTPDGEHIIYRNDREIWSIPRSGGEPRRLEWPMEESLMVALRGIEFSPDGRRIAFDAESGEEELWVMENFLPGH